MVLEDLDSTAIKAPEGSVDGGGGAAKALKCLCPLNNDREHVTSASSIQ